ncbi:MAG: TlpA disulfide reductase family protein [Planctomycetota bacterium]
MSRPALFSAALAALVVFAPACVELNAEIEREPVTADRLIGQPAPPLTAPRLDGGIFDVREASKNGEVLLLDFWATYCPPCRITVPLGQQVVDALREEGHAVRMVAVNVDEPAELVRDWMEDMGFSGIDVALNLDQDAGWFGYHVEFMPMAFVINADGIVTAVHPGYHPGLGAEIRRDLLQALSAGTSAEDL